MKITVLSGKGGTGKTTIATNLALSLENVQFFDTDVEEPNSYLFLKPDFADNEQTVWRKVPIIEQSKCNSCRKCVDFCQYNALAMLGDEVLVYPEVCHSCGGCKHICPQDAITEEKRSVGKINWDLDIDGLEYWQGELTIGEASSIPIISKIKKEIKDEKLVIIDAPPGTTCPTIEATIDSDYAILVTEPTPFGLHDLKMAVELVEDLDKPYGVIINRSQQEADGIIQDYCKKNGIPILLKVPFKRQIAKLYSEGIPFVEELPKWKDKFREVIDNL
ncbi:ATP-binding protein [Natroniella acetigena]|uniref:P-loop NTPase n=1 Tax=Natroniella acetigena TaxID=52004 RepID=UPI00200AFDE8|nr:ATP-binding protein [Natroniella acetigena]MCK8827662.1 ATP-binding protein [Natroniella acetigena]